MILRAVFWLTIVALLSPERPAKPALSQAGAGMACAWTKALAQDVPCTDFSAALPPVVDALRHDLLVRLQTLRGEIEVAESSPATSLPPE